MRIASRVVALTTIAAVITALASSWAVARVRVEARPSGAVRLTAARLTFVGEVDAICDVTLAGSIRRLVTKTRGQELGALTSETVNNCTSSFGGPIRVRFLTAGMTLSYGSIEGTLPTIRGFLIELFAGVLIEMTIPIIGRIGCLYRGTIGMGAVNPVTSPRVLSANIALVQDLRLGGRACPVGIELAGLFGLVPTQTIALLER